MPPSTPKTFCPSRFIRESESGLVRDLTWDRPVFRPPLLPNLRVIFDPLPFMAQRLIANSRQAGRR
jgi:hypothetical protein